jgi:hypothetical protein
MISLLLTVEMSRPPCLIAIFEAAKYTEKTILQISSINISNLNLSPPHGQPFGGRTPAMESQRVDLAAPEIVPPENTMQQEGALPMLKNGK